MYQKIGELLKGVGKFVAVFMIIDGILYGYERMDYKENIGYLVSCPGSGVAIGMSIAVYLWLFSVLLSQLEERKYAGQRKDQLFILSYLCPIIGILIYGVDYAAYIIKNDLSRKPKHYALLIWSVISLILILTILDCIKIFGDTVIIPLTASLNG